MKLQLRRFLARQAQGGPYNRLIFHFESSGDTDLQDVEIAQSSSIDDGAESDVKSKDGLQSQSLSTSKYMIKFLFRFGKA